MRKHFTQAWAALCAKVLEGIQNNDVWYSDVFYVFIYLFLNCEACLVLLQKYFKMC